MNRVLLGLLGAVVVVVLFLVFRPGDGGDDNASPPPPPTASGTTTTRTGTGTPQPPRPTMVRIVVEGGRVAGGLRQIRLERGDRAVIVVRADVSDEVHLHGYDIMSDVAPNRPARLRFRATIPGRFEIELESRKLQIAQLEVRP